MNIMNNHSSYHNTKHDRFSDHNRSTSGAITQGNAEARLPGSGGDARRTRKKGKGRDRDRGFRVIHSSKHIHRSNDQHLIFV